ncbi:MAG: DUF3047 domain-containing protein [Oceanospirillaceae bacterium]
MSFVLLISSSTFISAQALTDFKDWKQKNFVGNNQYKFSLEKDMPMVKISSNQTSSGLFLEKKINLNKSPILNWSWKVSNVLQSLKEKTKQGDDFAARVYVLTSTGPFPWQKKTLSYVWSNYQKIGSSWPNPYTGKVIMIALDSGKQRIGEWRTHQRNVQQDLEAAFGEKYDKIDVIAIMTDTDNSKQKAVGWYKNMYFSAK